MGFLDNIIRSISPSWALSRELDRIKLAYIDDTNKKRDYDAAGYSRRTAGMRAPQTSATTEVGYVLSTLRGRSRQFTQNNPYAGKAVRVVASNVVGTGIRCAISGSKKKAVERVKAAWKSWAEKVACDFDGRENLYGLQKLIARTVVESGECLIVRKTNPAKRGMPLELQVLEGDFIDTLRHSYTGEAVLDGGFDFFGIRFDKEGRRIGYWLFERHPTDPGATLESRLVPAEQVIHVYERLRPSQHRGVPTGVAAFLRMRDFDDYEQAQLMRQKVAACFSVFVHQPSLGTPTSNKEIFERVEPGLINYLNPGEDIRFAAPPPTEGYESYSRQQLRSIAAAYGITYESLTGDLSNVNFSSFRAGWVEMKRVINTFQRDVMYPALDQIFQWFIDYLAISSGQADSVLAEWTAPRMEMVDPVKETTGLIQQVRGGLKSYQEALREMGYDPEDNLAEFAEWYKMLDDKGLKLATDLRAEMKPAAQVGDGLAAKNAV